MAIKSITLTPLDPIESPVKDPTFLLCDNKYKYLYVLSHGWTDMHSPTNPPRGLAKINIADPYIYDVKSDMFYASEADRSYPFSFSDLDDFLFVSVTDDGKGTSCIVKSKLTGSPSIPIYSKILPTEAHARFYSNAYDSLQKKIFAFAVNEGKGSISAFQSGQFEYNVTTNYNSIESLTIDNRTQTCYFIPTQESIIGYFSTLTASPQIQYINIPDKGIMYGDKTILDTVNGLLFIPILTVDGKRKILALDTNENYITQSIDVNGELESFNYLVLDSLRQLLFYVTSTPLGELHVTPISTVTFDVLEECRISLPKGTGQLRSFAIHIQDDFDVIYGVNFSNGIVPVRIDFTRD
ncbi:hypothetical protein [Brucella rhizosphaerae]|uniref:Uncharacterized protein n=1 Tax=Brucella rhizosphaerae TaxID=571254 RepID=A0A256FUR9_9HYPH|nr:hypothetical protein [Brucella rhizosphaerae]OYR18563.1 hypothetical protein CEV32_3033 [Brucella rhizosphaerae]